MVEFDLERLRGKKVVVNCKTWEHVQNFVNWAYNLNKSNGKHNYYNNYKEDTCFRLDNSLSWKYGDKGRFGKDGYEIISYGEALLKEEKSDDVKEDKISLTVEQLKRFYLEAYKEGETAKLVCGKMSSKSLNSLEDKDWMTTLIKALNK